MLLGKISNFHTHTSRKNATEKMLQKKTNIDHVTQKPLLNIC